MTFIVIKERREKKKNTDRYESNLPPFRFDGQIKSVEICFSSLLYVRQVQEEC